MNDGGDFVFSKLIDYLLSFFILEISSDRDENAEETTDRTDHEGSSGTGRQEAGREGKFSYYDDTDHRTSRL